MYEIVKNVIASKRYALDDMLKKIDTLWVQGDITEEQKKELVTLAQTNADPEQSNAPLQKQIEELAKQQIESKETIAKMQSEIKVLKETIESGGTVVPEPEPTPQEEYPAWEPYNGIPPVKWQTGSKCTHNGKKWESMVDNNVWEPGAFGVDQNIWKEVV